MDEYERETGLSAESIARCAQGDTFRLPLDVADSMGENLEPEDFQEPDLWEKTSQRLLRKNLTDVLEALREMEREVLKLYYGIGCGVCFSLAQIGNRFHLSRERVRQIKEKGLKRLRHLCRISKLNLFSA